VSGRTEDVAGLMTVTCVITSCTAGAFCARMDAINANSTAQPSREANTRNRMLKRVLRRPKRQRAIVADVASRETIGRDYGQRYLTATHIGIWAHAKANRFTLA
jgi:hypothetical protein